MRTVVCAARSPTLAARPTTGREPYSRISMRRPPIAYPGADALATPERPSLASETRALLLDFCLISVVARRCRQSQNMPISRLFLSGASRDRTGDLLLAKQALSQLSYGPARPSVGQSRLAQTASGVTSNASVILVRRYSLKSKSRGGRCSNQSRSCSGVSRRKSGVSSSTSSTCSSPSSSPASVG